MHCPRVLPLAFLVAGMLSLYASTWPQSWPECASDADCFRASCVNYACNCTVWSWRCAGRDAPWWSVNPFWFLGLSAVMCGGVLAGEEYT